MIEEIRKLPKIELHIHLDGSISPELASKLSRFTIDEVKEKMIAKDKCKNLSEYLTKFDFPISLMQTKENLTLITKDLVNRLASEEVIYAEIRFAPMFHTKKGLTYEEIIEAVLAGLHTNSKIKTNLILCMMRGMNKEDNLKTIETAAKYLNRGVCAIDLAGAEDKYPIDNYLELFEIAKQRGIPFTIHAGENGGADEVKKAIEVGAKRIGHGIHAIEDEEVLNLIKEKDILLEICPTSNVQTNAIGKYQDHPIKQFYKKGIPFSINTDNTTVSNISLNEEYDKLSTYFNFTSSDYLNINQLVCKHTFLSKEEQSYLLDLLNDKRNK